MKYFNSNANKTPFKGFSGNSQIFLVEKADKSKKNFESFKVFSYEWKIIFLTVGKFWSGCYVTACEVRQMFSVSLSSGMITIEKK